MLAASKQPPAKFAWIAGSSQVGLSAEFAVGLERKTRIF
jgi:hypothetical protein